MIYDELIHQGGKKTMKLTHSCIISENVKKLSDFYKEVLQIEPQTYGDNYIEFPTDGGVLSLFSFKAHEELAKCSTIPSSNRCLELECRDSKTTYNTALGKSFILF